MYFENCFEYFSSDSPLSLVAYAAIFSPEKTSALGKILSSPTLTGSPPSITPRRTANSLPCF